MNKNPLVSVVVPAYNYGRFLPRCLDSLLAQTLADWECLIADDGSRDDTPEIARSYVERDSRFRYLRQENKGLSAARNLGIRNRRGEYLQFLDADDLIEPEKLESQARFLQENPGVGIVYSEARYFFHPDPGKTRLSSREPDQAWMPGVSGPGSEIAPHLVRGNIMAVNCALVRAEVFERVGLFDESLPNLEDWEFWLRCALNGEAFSFQDREGARGLVRLHESSMSRDTRAMLRGFVSLRTRFSGLLRDPVLIRINRRGLYNRIGDLGVREVLAGKRLLGTRLLARAGAGSLNPKWLVYLAAGLVLPRSGLAWLSGPLGFKKRLRAMLDRRGEG